MTHLFKSATMPTTLAIEGVADFTPDTTGIRGNTPHPFVYPGK
jgi:hypothetical protein